MTELIPSLSLDNLLNQRHAVLERIQEASRLLREAYTMCQAAHLRFPNLGYHPEYGKEIRLEDGDKIAKAVDASAWHYLMQASGTRSFLDAAARAQWDAKIAAHDVPPLTVANIQATFTSLYESRTELFHRGVINLFRQLSWDYQTNSPFQFGKRLILHRLLSLYGRGFALLNTHACNELDDLLRAFCVLDGQPEPDHRNGMHQQLSRAREVHEHALVTPYFVLKWYKKGTGHLTFTRLDLVAQLNAILHRYFPHAIPARQ
ncbi:MAG: DUF4942 domain-containing protein [Deltaproteobacteria bacterium]|nr:DUF4942 domain-containing protein [Deltaproteobacteria bacterium]